MSTYARIDKQTDKTETKVCPCTYPACPNAVEVNAFYAPAKARCNDHKGQTSSTIRAAVASGAHQSAAAPVVPVRSLADLRCPFDDRALELIKIEDVGPDRAFLHFACRGDDGCGSAVTIQPRWSGLIVRDIPEDWRPFVEQHNATAKQTNTDARARRLAAEADERALKAEAEAVAAAEAAGTVEPAKKKGWAEKAQRQREKKPKQEGGHKAGGRAIKRKMGS